MKTLQNGALIAHEETKWVDANGRFVFLWLNYVDIESEIKSAVKYVPLRDLALQLLHPSLVDLVEGREDRVEHSFEHLFKDGTVTVACELQKNRYVKKDNFPAMDGVYFFTYQTS